MGGEEIKKADVPPELRHRKGVERHQHLAANPGAPQWGTQVKRKDGSTIILSDPVINRVILALMDMQSVLGGAACHWGGPSGFAEIVSAVHGLIFTDSKDWREDFNVINDAGHCENGIFALKANYKYADVTVEGLKGFRAVDSVFTGHGERHLFPEGIQVSNGPLGSAVTVAEGLAMADAVTFADPKRVTIALVSDGAFMEGEAKEAFASIPGFAGKGQLGGFVAILSDNNTKLSGRIDEDAFSMHPSFDSLEPLGWHVIKVEEGNDLQPVFLAVEEAVALARSNRRKPVAVWVRTTKGYPVKSCVDAAAGGHGFPLSKPEQLRPFVQEVLQGKELPEELAAWLATFDKKAEEMKEGEKKEGDKEKTKEKEGEKKDDKKEGDKEKSKDKEGDKKKEAAKPPPKKAKVQAGFGKGMVKAADAGLPVVCVSADLPGSTGTAPFHAKYPQFAFDAGVAEANMASIASGMAMRGYVAVVDTFAQFGATKTSLPLYMTAINMAPIICCYTHTGFQDAGDGASHQSTTYFNMLCAHPSLEIYSPATSEEAEWAIEHAIKRMAEDFKTNTETPTVVFFCGREDFPVSVKPAGEGEYKWGKAMVLRDTTEGTEPEKRVTISAVGYMVCFAAQVVDELADWGIGVVLLNNSTPNRVDVDSHLAALAKTRGRLITVEDGQVLGGAGSLLVSALAQLGFAPRVKLLGVHGVLGRSAHKATDLYDLHGNGPKGIVAAARALVA